MAENTDNHSNGKTEELGEMEETEEMDKIKNIEDIDLFMQEMRDTTPLKNDRHVSKKRSSRNDAPGIAARRKAAEMSLEDPNFLILSDPPPIAPFDIIEYKKEGVQQGVYRRFKKGRYPIDATINLTRKRISEAREALFAFINESCEADFRTVLVLHGKGLSAIKSLNDRSEASKRAILKSYTAAWLKQFPQVIAYHSAQKHHGGLTGTYVMLQKSERLKEQNRGRYTR